MTVYINPPPQDCRCEVCGRIAPLMKDFREISGWITASWECCNCFPLSDEDARELQLKRWHRRSRIISRHVRNRNSTGRGIVQA